jgi:Protein of unknown function (DUF2723)
VTPRRTALLAGGVMLVVYIATLAPSVTFWDAGEFIASARVLGIPHPPGTPLFIVVLTSWARLFAFLPFAVATNLFSAVSTASAVALTAWFVARAMPSPAWGLSAITAGAMASVWQNATETEVYAASLALSIAIVVVADVAGRSGERRWLVLAAYLIALSIPLHLSALVAAPAAIYLAARRPDATVDWGAGSILSGAAVATFAMSRTSVGWGVVALLLFLTPSLERRRAAGTATLYGSMMAAVATLAAFSGVLFLLLRARHDPAINQGNPATWSALGDVLTRRQYAVAGLWPRQAPVWIQLANWFEYADWQFALGLGPTVIPTLTRVLATIAFAALGIVGMQWHRATDRRTWAGVTLLFLSGSLGVLVYLNLKAGTSFAWHFVPSAADHEARDRDYFFVLGFWAWGIWAGLGALVIARRLRWSPWVGLALVAAPIGLNWSAVNRRREPEASLPREVAAILLDSLPPHAVLFVAGDNDTYPLWFAQQVEHRRTDVTVVTLPLLVAPWYLDELGRRDGFAAEAGRDAPISRSIAESARAHDRPVAVALTVPDSERNLLTGMWKVNGVFVVQDSTSPQENHLETDRSRVVSIDTERVRAAMFTVEAWRKGRGVQPSTDPAFESFLHTLSCPSLILGRTATGPALTSLDSTCNPR